MPSLAANSYGTGTAFTYDAVYTLTNGTGTAFTSGTMTNTATYDQAWTTSASTITIGGNWTTPQPVPSYTRAEQEQRDRALWARMQLDAQRCQDEHGERVAARERAEALLNSVLTPAQRESWALHRWFEVAGSQGGQYRIGYGRVRNITRLDERGRGVETLCIHPDADVPDADTVAAQKLYLESDEAALLRTANHLPVAA